MLKKGSMQATTRGLTFIRRLILVVAFVISAAFLPQQPLFAQSESLGGAVNNVDQASIAAGVGPVSDLPTIVGRIINIFLGFVGVLLLCYLLYAGFLWMTASGDPKQVDKAKTVIRQAIIGLVIITASFAIARFVLSFLADVSDPAGGIGGSGAPGVGFPGSAGALGGGVIESHVPQRDARDVPRNTAIAIQFKEPIKISSLIEGYDDKGTPADVSDDVVTTGLNQNSIKIFQTAAGRTTALTSAQVRVAFTVDRRSFVFKPVEYLGSPTAKSNYTVELTTGVQRQDGRAALTSSGYKWQFEVSTVIDNTAPRVTSVVPYDGGRFAPNVIVQVNFDEAVDPTSASGVFSADASLGRFINMSIDSESTRAGTQQVTGEFKAVNGFRTVEFVSDSSCGLNSCGKQVYCLPYDSSITATVKAASLSDTAPQAILTASGYNGVVDMAGNSLDGDSDGKAEGPGVDDRIWRFGTETAPNLNPPKIRETEPPAQTPPSPAAQNLPLDHKPSATFDSVLQLSTVNSETVKLLNNEPASLGDTFWWTVVTDAYGVNAAGLSVPASGTVQPTLSKLSIAHRVYLPPQEQPMRFDYEYDPRLDQGIQNIYQNCFYPAASLLCSGPTCCNNTSRADCGFPPRP